MKKLLIITFAILQINIYAQTKIIFVYDINTKEPIVGASIFVNNKLIGFTDNDGKFYGYIKQGKKVTIKFLGYYPKTIIADSAEKAIGLKIKPYDVSEIMIYSTTAENFLSQNNIGQISITNKQIQLLPSLLGETDPFKILQNYAGISWSNEGSSNLIVRGSSGSENLILIDGAPVFNITHLGGFFAIIPAPAIKNLTFYKSAIPAKFFGRTASVIDITLNEGNKNNLQTQLDISNLSFNLNFQAPIIKDKVSFMINFRKSYPDLFISPFLEENIAFKLNFYDFITKLTWNLNNRLKIFLTYYYGNDLIRESETYKSFIENNTFTQKYYYYQDFRANWYNHLFSLRINKIWTNNFLTTFLIYSSTYEFKFILDYYNSSLTNYFTQNQYLFDSIASYTQTGNFIQQNAIKQLNKLIINNKYNIEFGYEIGFQKLTPNINIFNYYRNTISQNDTIKGAESYIFANIEEQLFSNLFFNQNININQLKLSLGVNLATYNNISYISIEPRLSASYQISKTLALKAAIFKSSQNIHLIVPTYLDLPVDYWTFSNEKIPPLKTWSFTAGIYFANKNLKVYSEAYFKKISNTIKILPGQNMFDFMTPWYEKVDIGQGKAYGIELSLEYTNDKVKILTNYTYSKSIRQFEFINHGEPFHFKYDRTHYFNILLSYILNKKININLSWHFTGGFWITVPEQTIFYHSTLYELSYGRPVSYSLLGFREPVISSINNYRLPPYNRLDFSINYIFGKKENTLTFGLYNAYNRKNIFSVIYQDGQFFAIYLFPILPYFKLTIKI